MYKRDPKSGGVIIEDGNALLQRTVQKKNSEKQNLLEKRINILEQKVLKLEKLLENKEWVCQQQ